jgi:hypothetical protein
MAKVGVGNEALLERLIFAYDGTNYRVVKCDASGNLVAGLVAGSTIEVTQDTASALLATVSLAADQNVQARAYGWISGAWQKNPLLLGFSDTVQQATSTTTLPAGTSAINGEAVPAGEMWLITNMSMRMLSATITVLSLYLVIDGAAMGIFQQPTPATNVIYDRQGHWALGPGDNVRGVVAGATLNDDFFMEICGIRVDLDQ